MAIGRAFLLQCTTFLTRILTSSPLLRSSIFLIHMNARPLLKSMQLTMFLSIVLIFVTFLCSTIALPVHDELHDYEKFPRSILLRTRHIDTLATPEVHEEPHPSFRTLSFDELKESKIRSVFLLHLRPGQRDSLQKYLAESHNDTQLLDYLPHNTFLITTTHENIVALRKRDEVLWVGNLHPKDKISVDALPESVLPNLRRNRTKPKLFSSTSFNKVMSLNNGSPAQVANASIPDLDSAAPDEPFTITISLTKQVPPRSQSDLLAFVEEIEQTLSSLPDIADRDSISIVPVLTRMERVQVLVGSAEDFVSVSQALSLLPMVAMISRRMPIIAQNKWARGIVDSGLTTSVDYNSAENLLSWKYNLRGQNQVIGVADSGMDVNHCFLRDSEGTTPFVSYSFSAPTTASIDQGANHRKVVSYVSFADTLDMSGHGTHVVGSIVGNSEDESKGYNQFDGIASKSRVAFFDLGKPRNQAEVLEVPFDLGAQLLHWAFVSGARVHSDSWGSNTAEYTTDSRDFDEYMWEHKDFVVLVAAGNDGECAEAQSLGSPASAKNVIAVGASMSNLQSYTSTGYIPPSFYDNQDKNNEDDMAFFSSVGPTSDGRIKPDVVAPGFGIWSAAVNGGTCSSRIGELLSGKSGTSMATPVLAGNLLLIRQYFAEGYYPTGTKRSEDAFIPSGALLKAMVIGAAVPLRGYRLLNGNQCSSRISFANATFPNFHQGYGRPQLSHVLEFRAEQTQGFHTHVLGHDRSQDDFGDPSFSEAGQSHTYNLCYRDVASIPTPTLDHVRVSLVWTDAPGNVGGFSQLVNDLNLEVRYKGELLRGNGQQSSDRLNTVESVDLNIDGSSSDIEVLVKASAINRGPQPYSVVVIGAVREATCSQVLSGEAIYDGKDLSALQKTSSSTSSLNDEASSTNLVGIAFSVVAIAIVFVTGHKSLSLLRHRQEQREKNAAAEYPADRAVQPVRSPVAGQRNITQQTARMHPATLSTTQAAKAQQNVPQYIVPAISAAAPTAAASMNVLAPVVPSPSSSAAAAPAPVSSSQWVMLYSQQHRRYFYWNSTTKQSYWAK